MHERSDLRSVRDLVLLWGDPPRAAYEALASDVGTVEWFAVRDWARRGRIPAQHIDAIVMAAAAREFAGITHALVLRLVAAEQVA